MGKMDLASPLGLAGGILQKFDEFDRFDLRVYGVYTGNVTDPASMNGNFGFLPIAGNSTGDLLALAHRPGKSLAEWDLVELPHNGEGAKTIGKGIESFIPAFLVHHGRHFAEFEEDLKTAGKEILALAEFTGGARAKAATQKILGLIEDGNDPLSEMKPLELQLLAEGEGFYSEFLRRYESAYSVLEGEKRNGDPVKLWTEYLGNFPFFEPARALLFGASRAGGGEEALDCAWNLFQCDRQIDNYWSFEFTKQNGYEGYDLTDEAYDLLFDEDHFQVAARYLIENGGEEKYGGLALWPAVQTVADEGPAHESFTEAAFALEKMGDHGSAYTAFRNASYYKVRYDEEGDAEYLQGALRCAEALKDEALIEILRAAVEETGDDDEDSEEEE